jgi:vacuolar-type H+-ATPase subunit F/Vma7
MTNSIGVIGDRDVVFAFSSLGFSGFEVENREKGLKALSSSSNLKVIFVEEKIARELKDEIDSLKREGKVFIEIPGIRGSTGYTKKRIKRMVVNAVGMDIFKEEKGEKEGKEEKKEGKK